MKHLTGTLDQALLQSESITGISSIFDQAKKIGFFLNEKEARIVLDAFEQFNSDIGGGGDFSEAYKVAMASVCGLDDDKGQEIPEGAVCAITGLERASNYS